MTLTRARANTTDGEPGYIYLASPYSHELPEVREQRFREAQRAARGPHDRCKSLCC